MMNETPENDGLEHTLIGMDFPASAADSASGFPHERMEQLRYANLLLCKLPEPAQGPCLVLDGGEAAPEVHPLRDALVIGRSESLADLVIDSPELSKRHLCFHDCGDSDWEIEDLESSNGSFVNRERLEGRLSLNAGDVIEAGGRLFLFIA